MRILEMAAKYLLIAIVALYSGDWSVFQVRRIRGGGMATVAVDQFLATTLKGNKAEYDYLGTANQKCSRTLLPQYAEGQLNVPCWWLARHKASWQ